MGGREENIIYRVFEVKNYNNPMYFSTLWSEEEVKGRMDNVKYFRELPSMLWYSKTFPTNNFILSLSREV